VGQPAAFGNLTVFPILRQRQLELGKFTSLEAAVRANHAEIREVATTWTRPTRFSAAALESTSW